MSEHYKNRENGPESHNTEAEVKRHHERLKNHHEKSAERAQKYIGHEKEVARHEVYEHAVSATEYANPTTEQQREPRPITVADKSHVFETVMHHARQGMTKPERTFSKFIHKPVIEKTSDALGKTVVRPSGITGATIAAFIGLLSIYGIAKFAGFELSGSEMPLLLVTGFIAGLLVEWILKAARSIFLPKNE